MEEKVNHSVQKFSSCFVHGVESGFNILCAVVTELPVSSRRYQCDQCPYRCHRMDQLNSHKLRHQDKSLMCEICAYACKRKYELRNHMLAKHSGEDKQPSVYKCKYCTYTSCYRQALQNHENCKHTKLREFRCALCFYSSFSSISLFLHKRKAHGYIPGDKAWLENYAGKERERNSTEASQDFYNKPATAHEPFEQPTHQTSQREQSDHLVSADHSASKETLADSQNVDSVEVFDVVSQEVVNEGVSESPPSVNSPEEYCTLVLTTLSTTDYQAPSLLNEEGNGANQTLSSPILKGNSSDVPQEKEDVPSPSLVEDDVAMAEAESGQSDLDDSYEPLAHTSQLSETQTADGENDCGTIRSSSQNQSAGSELRLKAMKKHDKDQAEAMILEGRVQMLLVPTTDVYRCDRCSYVTSKETSLKYHCQALCHARIRGHKCQACGAQFKQRRGLESHRAKKCPSLPRKTRIFLGVSNARLTAEEKSVINQEGLKQQDEGNDSENRICTDSNDQKFIHLFQQTLKTLLMILLENQNTR